MFYGSKSWSYTRLGHIDGLSESELRTFLKAGESNIAVTLSLALSTGINGLTPNPSPKGKGNIYTLSGQRLAQAPARGIYIENGIKRNAR